MGKQDGQAVGLRNNHRRGPKGHNRRAQGEALGKMVAKSVQP